VRTPFELAARYFAPQKGADAAAVERLTRRLEVLAANYPRDPRGMPMGGAAGGLAGGLWATLGAELRAGAPFVLEAIRFDARLRACRAVIVGEGRLDATTLEGKALGEIATRARQSGVPTHAIVGSNAMSRFDTRILDLQTVIEASAVDAIERAAQTIAKIL
jgi:glycerate kinase